tara:strand:- start:173 stop:340 length:168 start_codon:yes stop_codon:yes gene_type:complete
MNINTLTKLYTKYKKNGIEILVKGGIAASFKIDLVLESQGLNHRQINNCYNKGET